MLNKGLVSVITVTKERDNSLLIAVASVASQDYLGKIEHIIIVDDRVLSLDYQNRLKKINPNIKIKSIKTSSQLKKFLPFYSVSRVGYLRNCGIKECLGDYIAYLDDDNTFLPNHISSLVSLLEDNPKAKLAYSWRFLWNADRSPFLAEKYPWVPKARLAFDNDKLSHYIYQQLIANGVRDRNSNIQKDTLIAKDGSAVYTVDTSELLVHRDVHDSQQWVTAFKWREMVGDYSDDYAFVKNCFEAGMPFVCSKQATVNYFLSGVSNNSEKRS